ncbi:MAG TPA: hypothetical protein VK501_13890 [Baekduia sp.]|uniref:hypothetical protein n=1 Tax=Baekduia sp. TaxID=2600305 RepID=UPI002B5B0899|nr:hypothetical protein [Baekduia sp.]HMJ34999.1 hypothetical protein [Baekduia sp.]
MSHRFLKVLVLGATVVSALASASTASAVNWSSNGSASPGTAFNATAPASKLEIHVAIPSHLVGVTCTATTATGRLIGTAGPSNAGTWSDVATVRPTFSGCTAAGQSAVVVCSEGHFDAVSQASNVVTGNIRGISCTITALGCVISVTANLTGNTYNNTSSVLTVNGMSGITASWTNSAACRTLMGTTSGGCASATFGTTTSPPAALGFTVTSSFKPNIQHN